MKREIYILVLFISLFFIFDNVNAENFYEAEYFTTYVNKEKDNKTYYLTMQAIRDLDNNYKMVYCLEPFKFFDSNTTYRHIMNGEYELSKEQMDIIRKLTYYGYGYKPAHRNTYEWYGITQVLIWRIVDPSANIYFTDSLNGRRDDDKYQSKIEALLDDINSNRWDLDINKEYKVIYNNDLEIALNNNYEVIDSDLDYSYENNILKINNVKKDGYIMIREKANKEYTEEEIIYDSDDAQDLYLPGTLKDKELKINIDVIMGDITLNIFKDKETYSVDANFTNTCYGIFKDGNLIQKVCANDEFKYKTEELEIGDYEIKQLSNGVGYISDNNIYSVSINEYNLHPTVNLYNYIKSNEVNIVKKYCDEDRCSLENEAMFELYDSKSNLVDTYVTDRDGNISFKLGYGSYDVIQVQGKEGYKYINSFKVFIDDMEERLKYELYDNKIEEEKRQIEKEDILEEEEKEEEKEELIDDVFNEEYVTEENVCYENEMTNITPPDTGIVLVYKNNKWVKVVYNYIVDIIRRYAKYAILL